MGAAVLTGERATAIGLDVGEQTVAAVQLIGGPERWRVHRSTTFARPRLTGCSEGRLEGDIEAHASVSAHEAQAIAQAVRRQGMRGSRVSMSAPHGELVQALVTMPPSGSGAPIDKLARAELARIVRVQPGELESAYWNVEAVPTADSASRGQGHDVLTIGCRSSEAAALAEAFDDAGLLLARLDAGGCAIAAGVDAVAPSGAALRLVADVGWSATRVLAIQHGRPAYQRALPELGLSRLHARSRSEFGFGGLVLDRALVGQRVSRAIVDAVEHLVSRFIDALAKELRVSLGYVEDGFVEPVDDSIVLVGGGGEIAGICDRLSTLLDTPVIAPSALTDGAADRAVEHGDASHTRRTVRPIGIQALGLALCFD